MLLVVSCNRVRRRLAADGPGGAAAFTTEECVKEGQSFWLVSLVNVQSGKPTALMLLKFHETD
jgi:hypothetical protein